MLLGAVAVVVLLGLSAPALAHGELASTNPLKNTAGVPSMATGIAMAASSHASTLAQLATWRDNGRVEF